VGDGHLRLDPETAGVLLVVGCDDAAFVGAGGQIREKGFPVAVGRQGLFNGGVRLVLHQDPGALEPLNHVAGAIQGAGVDIADLEKRVAGNYHLGVVVGHCHKEIDVRGGVIVALYPELVLIIPHGKVGGGAEGHPHLHGFSLVNVPQAAPRGEAEPLRRGSAVCLHQGESNIVHGGQAGVFQGDGFGDGIPLDQAGLHVIGGEPQDGIGLGEIGVDGDGSPALVFAFIAFYPENQCAALVCGVVGPDRAGQGGPAVGIQKGNPVTEGDMDPFGQNAVRLVGRVIDQLQVVDLGGAACFYSSTDGLLVISGNIQIDPGGRYRHAGDGEGTVHRLVNTFRVHGPDLVNAGFVGTRLEGVFKVPLGIGIDGIGALETLQGNDQIQGHTRQGTARGAVHGLARDDDILVAAGGLRRDTGNFPVIGGVRQGDVLGGGRAVHDDLTGFSQMIVDAGDD